MKRFSVCLISLIGLAYLLIAMGFRINLTDSIPVGLYRITHEGELKNAYVIFCPDNRHAFKLGLDRSYIDQGLNCGGYGYLMKKVVAVSGDILSVTDEGVFVNQILIPYSKPKSQDGMNRALPQWRVRHYQLQVDEIMTMTSQSEWSFDGRYYGLVHIRQIKGMIIPIWVINQAETSNSYIKLIAQGNHNCCPTCRSNSLKKKLFFCQQVHLICLVIKDFLLRFTIKFQLHAQTFIKVCEPIIREFWWQRG